MAARRSLSSSLFALALLASLPFAAAAQSGPSPVNGNAMRRTDSGTGVTLRTWSFVGRIGGFVQWTTPRLLPGVGRSVRTIESNPVRSRTFPSSRVAGSRLP